MKLKGDSSLLGADTNLEARLPIKGTERVAKTVGVARSSLICVESGIVEAGTGLGAGVNCFCNRHCRIVSREINVYIGWRFCNKKLSAINIANKSIESAHQR